MVFCVDKVYSKILLISVSKYTGAIIQQVFVNKKRKEVPQNPDIRGLYIPDHTACYLVNKIIAKENLEAALK
jgi:hypothetical protein